MSEERSIRMKRLRFRSWHRGCKETDIILGTFADRYLETLDDASLAAFEALMEEDDAIIWDWLTEKYPPENTSLLPLLEKLKLHAP